MTTSAGPLKITMPQNSLVPPAIFGKTPNGGGAAERSAGLAISGTCNGKQHITTDQWDMAGKETALEILKDLFPESKNILEYLDALEEEAGEYLPDILEILPRLIQIKLSWDDLLFLLGETIYTTGLCAPEAIKQIPAALETGLDPHQVTFLFGKIRENSISDAEALSAFQSLGGDLKLDLDSIPMHRLFIHFVLGLPENSGDILPVLSELSRVNISLSHAIDFFEPVAQEEIGLRQGIAKIMKAVRDLQEEESRQKSDGRKPDKEDAEDETEFSDEEFTKEMEQFTDESNLRWDDLENDIWDENNAKSYGRFDDFENRYTRGLRETQPAGVTNSYQVLGMENRPNLSQRELKAIYYARAKQTHPDLNRKDPIAAEKFNAVRGAYEQICHERGWNP